MQVKLRTCSAFKEIPKKEMIRNCLFGDKSHPEISQA